MRSLGIHHEYLRRLCADGRLVRAGRGLYMLPDAEVIICPTLLDFPGLRIRACPRETVVAEKLHTIVVLGVAVVAGWWGLLSPIMGAVVHNIGSVLVVLSSASLAFASDRSDGEGGWLGNLKWEIPE